MFRREWSWALNGLTIFAVAQEQHHHYPPPSSSHFTWTVWKQIELEISIKKYYHFALFPTPLHSISILCAKRVLNILLIYYSSTLESSWISYDAALGLSDAGREVVALDLLNHGEAARSKTMNYPLLAQIVHQFIASNYHHCNVDILGHSMVLSQFKVLFPMKGGKVVMEMMLTDSISVQLRRCIILDSAPCQVSFSKFHTYLAAMSSIAHAKFTTKRNANDNLLSVIKVSAACQIYFCC